MIKKDNFKIFDDEELGRMFVPDGERYDDVTMFCISPHHGRAVAVKTEEGKWISVKGGGWNYGGPQIYMSLKDEELIFGLYPLSSAVRELAVSQAIEKISNRFPKVLYYRKIEDEKLSPKYNFLKNVKFSNGSAVCPCLLYTKVNSPFRVADLMYLDQNERENAIGSCCEHWGIGRAEYTKRFTEELAKSVAILHKNGFINDTLEYGNVTLFSEIIDYEWVTAPNIELLNGTLGLEITEERKEKEILYGAEICMQLRALLHEEYNLFDIYSEFVDSYSSINSLFTLNNERVEKILRKESFIL